MRSLFTLVAIVACAISCDFCVLAADEESETAGEDSSVELPEQYAKDYLIARSTVSPDKKLAVIYPTLEAEEAAEKANHPEGIKNYVVALQPFTVLGELQTKYPYFQNQSNGGLSGEWSDDSSVALITLDGKWVRMMCFCWSSAMGSRLERPTFLQRPTIWCCQITGSPRPNRTTTFSTSFLMARTVRCSSSTAQTG